MVKRKRRNGVGAIGEAGGAGALGIENTHAQLAQRRVQRRRRAGVVVAPTFADAHAADFAPAVWPEIAIVIYPQHLIHFAAFCGWRFLRLQMVAQRD